MKRTIFLIFILILSSCEKQKKSDEVIQKGFITESKTYYWGDKNIIVKDIEDNCKIFAITDKRNRIIYQQPLNIVFSDYHYWILYADDTQNIYFYNSDYSQSKALIWNSELNKYNELDFCNTKVDLPKDFIDKLKSKASLKNCKSI